MERPQLTTSDLKRALQLANDVVNNFSDIGRFMDRCLIFKNEMETIIAPYKDMQKMKQSSSRFPSPTPLYTLNCSVNVVPFSQKF